MQVLALERYLAITKPIEYQIVAVRQALPRKRERLESARDAERKAVEERTCTEADIHGLENLSSCAS